MEKPVSWEKLSWSPVFFTVILLLGALISFVIAYVKEDVSVYLPYISETGAMVPEQCVFSLVLVFASVIGIIVVAYRYLILVYLLDDSAPKLKKLNKVAFICGLVSMGGLQGVAAFPVSAILWAHLLAATIHFGFALFYVAFQTFITLNMNGISANLRRIRLGLGILLLNLLFLLVILFPLSYTNWFKVNSHLPALKTPKDKGFDLMLASALCEWLMYGTFLAYILSFTQEFRSFRLAMHVIPFEVKMNSEP